MQRWWFSGVVACLVMLLASVICELPDQKVHLYVCSVGQGDAILITYHQTQLLIDGGPDSSVLECIDQALPFWDKTLEMVIITHTDVDHVGGLPAVFDFYQVNSLALVPLSPDTQTVEQLYAQIDSLQDKGTRVLFLEQGDVLGITEDIFFKVINPIVNLSLEKSCKNRLSETRLWDTKSCFLLNKTSKNDLSIALIAYIHETSILLTGDMEKEAELATLNAGVLHRVDILKAGHHGSNSSCTREFLEVIRPEISIISVGKNNRYKHPAPQVLQRLEDIGSTILRTDTWGTVEILINQSGFTIEPPV